MGARFPDYQSIFGRRLGLVPNGLMADGVLVGNPFMSKGKIFYVDSSVTGGSGTNPSDAVGTLAAAVALCTADQGDIIVVAPNHSETISSNTALVLNVAGITVLGVGQGRGRPSFTLDTANTATIAVTAANVAFVNCRVIANFLSIAAAFTLTTAKSFRLENCSFSETSNVLNFLNIIKSTGAANTVDRLTAIDNTWNGLGTTSVNAFILTANDIDHLTVLRNKIKLARTADAAQIVVTAGVLTMLDCADNCVYTAQTATSNGSLINVGGTTSTGWVYRNFVQTLTTTADKLFTTTVGLGAFENRVSGAVGATGFVIPAVDS